MLVLNTGTIDLWGHHTFRPGELGIKQRFMTKKQLPNHVAKVVLASYLHSKVTII